MKKIIAGKTILDSLKIIKHSVLNFGTNNPVGMAGTTAYFAIFSIAPILIIIIAVFGFFTDDDTIRTKLFNELNTLIGQNSSEVLQTAIDKYKIAEYSGVGAIIGTVVFLISATTLFSILQNSINYIWRIKVKSKLKLNILKFLKDRVFSFGMILSLGFLLLISLVVDASINILKDIVSNYFNPEFVIVINVANIVLSLFITASVFAIIFRFLPDVSVKWKASWFGAGISLFLFLIGKFLIGYIIGNSQLGIIYGAASSFVAILVWIYYVSIIFYFGVEITRQYSIFYKHKNKPLNFAVPFEITSAD